MASQPIDYDALAKQSGAVSSAAAPASVDYDALAKQNGATDQPGALSRFAHGVYDTTVGPLAQAVMHPLDTLKAIGKQAIGKDDLDAIAASVKSGDYKGAALNLGKWVAGRTPEGASLETGYSLLQPTIEAVKQGDVPTAAGRGLGTAATLAVPGAAGKVAEGTDALADSTAQALTKSALKGGYTVNTPAEDVSAAATAMRQNNVPLTPAGTAKITQALADVRQATQTSVNDAAARGVSVDPGKVVERLDDVRQRYSEQVNPDQDLRDIDNVRKNFLNQHTITTPAKPASAIVDASGNPATPATPASTRAVPIPADQAQAVKVGSNALNADKYGKISTAQVEAEKALTRGIKEELETQIPELGALNANQAKLMNLDDVLAKAVNKYTNSAGFAGDLSHTGIAASALRSIIANPVLKARLASAIDVARRANPGKFTAAAGTGAAAVSSLIASLAPQQQ